MSVVFPVNISINIHKELLPFAYPSFYIRDSVDISTVDMDVIYNGESKPNLRNIVSSWTRSYILLRPPYDLDVATPQNMLNFLKNSYKISNRVSESFMDLPPDDQLDQLKLFFLLNKFEIDEDQESRFFQLVSSLSFRNALQIYVEEPPENLPRLEASFLTFLQRVKSHEDQEVSPGYKRALISADKLFGSRIDAVLLQSLRSKVPQPIRFLNTLIGLYSQR